MPSIEAQVAVFGAGSARAGNVTTLTATRLSLIHLDKSRLIDRY